MEADIPVTADHELSAIGIEGDACWRAVEKWVRCGDAQVEDVQDADGTARSVRKGRHTLVEDALGGVISSLLETAVGVGESDVAEDGSC